MIDLNIRVTVNNPEDIIFAKEIREEIKNANLEGILIFNQSVQYKPTEEGVTSTLGPIDWATIPVVLLASGGVITTILNIILSRLTRDRSVTLEIDGDKLTVTGIDSDEQKRLIELWLDRHQKPSKKISK